MRMLDIIAHVQAWCSTGYIHTGYNWGTCGPDCVWHEDTISWRKDETVKMTLQYYNHALWVGLEVYGSILLWIFPLGLILTTILPITGKVIVQSQFPIIVPIIQFQSSRLPSSRSQTSVSDLPTRWTSWTGLGKGSRTITKTVSSGFLF